MNLRGGGLTRRAGGKGYASGDQAYVAGGSNRSRGSGGV